MAVMLSSGSIYTLLDSNTLAGLLEASGQSRFSNNRAWTRGLHMLQAARANGLSLPIVFAPAERTGDVEFAAVVLELSIFDRETACTIVRLQRLSPAIPKSELILLSKGRALSPNDRRPYRLVRTHPALEALFQ